MAHDPDPAVELETLSGTRRTLDDWSTMFHLCFVILPDRPESRAWVPVGLRIFGVLGDADCRTAFVVTGTAPVAKRILAGAERQVLCLLDPDRALVRSLGLQRLPAFVHLRQDTTLVAATEGWRPARWQEVAHEVGRAMAWSVPEVAPPGTRIPPPTAGWAA